MAATTYDFTIEQGATFSLTFRWKDTAGNIINLSGFTARAQFRYAKLDDEILLSMTTENGRIILGGAAGTIQILLDAATTAAIDWTTARYDLELQDAAGFVTRLVEGKVKVSNEVTR